jgi:hypothetical protein
MNNGYDGVFLNLSNITTSTEMEFKLRAKFADVLPQQLGTFQLYQIQELSSSS